MFEDNFFDNIQKDIEHGGTLQYNFVKKSITEVMLILRLKEKSIYES